MSSCFHPRFCVDDDVHTHALFPPLSASDRIKLQGLEFPYTFDLTYDNLLFPLTKEAWEKDNRAFDDLGISALLDLDGKFSTANENDLLGFGISKPVAIAGSQVGGKEGSEGENEWVRSVSLCCFEQPKSYLVSCSFLPFFPSSPQLF